MKRYYFLSYIAKTNKPNSSSLGVWTSKESVTGNCLAWMNDGPVVLSTVKEQLERESDLSELVFTSFTELDEETYRANLPKSEEPKPSFSCDKPGCTTQVPHHHCDGPFEPDDPRAPPPPRMDDAFSKLDRTLDELGKAAAKWASTNRRQIKPLSPEASWSRILRRI